MSIVNHIYNFTVLLVSLLVFFVACYYLISSFVSTIRASWVPYVPSYNEDLERMKQKLELDLRWKTMIDLGCWDWKALRFFVKNFWVKKAVWYEFNWFAVRYGKLLNYFHKFNNIEIIKWNFLNADISNYDFIYVYLLTEYLEKIEDFVFDNMNENAIVISNTFKFKNHTPYLVTKNEKWRDRILLYKKN